MLKIYNKSTFFIIVSLAFLYYISGRLSLDLLSGDNIVNIGLFASEGIALAFALHFGKKVWSGIFIGQFILAYSNGINIFSSFEISTINSLEAILAIMLFNVFKLNKELKTFRDVIGLFLIIVFVLQIFSALLSNIALMIHSELAYKEYIPSSFSWWFGNVMGQLLFTPFLLLLFTNYKSINLQNYLFYGLIFGFYIYILEIIIVISNPFLLFSLTMPFIVFVVAKKGILYGTFLNVLIAIISSYAIYLSVGSFSSYAEIDNIINYNLFILAHISLTLTLGILFEEKKRYEVTLQETIKFEVEKNKEQQLLMLQQSRLAQMGEMISMIAHQWRQPLNNLSLVNQLLISKYNKNKLDDKALDYFKVNSKKQINLMTTTIDDFRNFFKMEKDKQKFCINEVVQTILGMVENIYKSHFIHIKYKLEKDYEIVGFPNALSQALLNILNNAKDALVENSVENKNIEIKIFEENDEIILSISDNAGGIAENIIDRIFDPYFSTKEEKNGTGLGLYMTKMIVVEKMAFKIDARNTQVGAEFRIYLKGKNCDVQ